MNDCIVCLDLYNQHVEVLPENRVCAQHWREAILAMLGRDARFRSAGIPLSLLARRTKRAHGAKVSS